MRVKLTQVLILAVVVLVAIILTLYVKGTRTGSSTGIYEPNMGLGGFRIMVPVFSNGSNIPSSYACNGVNFTASFPVIISNIPTGTKVLMVVMIDVDANMFIHWVLIDAPPVNYIPPNLPFLSRWRFLALHGLRSPPSTSQRSPWAPSPQWLPNGRPRFPASAGLGNSG